MNTAAFNDWSARLAWPLLGAALITSCQTPPAATTTAEVNDGSEQRATTPKSPVCAPEITEIDFGIISTESQTNLQGLWEPFLEALSADLGRPVNGFYATDYAGVVEAMGAGKIHLAWYGGKSYIEAARRSGAEAFAQVVASDGSPGYYAHLITNAANPIVAEMDLVNGKGDRYVTANADNLTFAFNDPNSTSGFLVPSYYVFAKTGIDPQTAFRELVFVGSHEATAQAIANHQVDVATNNSTALARLQATDPEAFEQIQIIWTSPLIPGDPIAYQADLPDCLKAQLQDFFHNFAQSSVLEPLGWAGFIPASDADWNAIRKLHLAQQIAAVRNQPHLSETAKSTQLQELERQLTDLQ